MRVVASNTYNAYIIVKIIQIFGWNKVNVIYANTTNNSATYSVFRDQCSKSGIEIANEENKRLFPATYNSSQFELVRGHFEHIRDNKVRIFVTLQPSFSNWQSMIGLYDVGLRNGDIIPIFPTKTGGPVVSNGQTKENEAKIFEMLTGSISVSAVEYWNDFGLKIKELMQKR